MLPKPLVVCVSLLLALTFVSCEKRSEGPQIIVLAIDGLEPQLLEELLRERQLPNIQRLIDGGSLARIRCVTKLLSPVVWTTVATGMAPAEHGITDFEIDGVPVRSSDRQVPAFWNLYSSLGMRSALVGWMVSWPAESDSGLIVSDRAHYGRFERKTFPPSLVELRSRQTRPKSTSGLARFTDYDFDGDYANVQRTDPEFEANFLVDRRLNRIFQRDEAYTSIATELLREHDPDLLALYIRGIDYVSHGFWQFFEPEPFRREGWNIRPSDIEQLGGIIPAYYEYLDDIVGRIVRHARRDSLIILLSDHGFGTALGPYSIPRGDFLSGNHREYATLIISGTGAQRGVTQTRQITHYDILPTLLWITGHPQARDFRGRPLREYLTDRFSASASVQSIGSYADVIGVKDEELGPTEEDESILEELRSLGYIE